MASQPTTALSASLIRWINPHAPFTAQFEGKEWEFELATVKDLLAAGWQRVTWPNGAALISDDPNWKMAPKK